MRAIGSIKAATAAAERFAVLEGQIDGIEAERNTAIAEANAIADKAAEQLLAERDKIREKLSVWWPTAAAELTKGKRKSIELGGCTVGTRRTRDTLAIAGREDDVLTILKTLRWAKPLVRIKYSIERVLALKATDGPRSGALAELGITRSEGVDVFFVERAEQGGTLAGADA